MPAIVSDIIQNLVRKNRLFDRIYITYAICIWVRPYGSFRIISWKAS